MSSVKETYLVSKESADEEEGGDGAGEGGEREGGGGAWTQYRGGDYYEFTAKAPSIRLDFVIQSWRNRKFVGHVLHLWAFAYRFPPHFSLVFW